MKKVIVSGLVVSLVMGMVSMGFCQESKDLQTIKYLAEKKSPCTALLWSLLIPGGGQIYNEEMTKGLLMMGGEIVLVATMFKEETTTEIWEDNPFILGVRGSSEYRTPKTDYRSVRSS